MERRVRRRGLSPLRITGSEFVRANLSLGSASKNTTEEDSEESGTRLVPLKDWTDRLSS